MRMPRGGQKQSTVLNNIFDIISFTFSTGALTTRFLKKTTAKF